MSELKSYVVWDAPTRWFHWINFVSVLGLAGVGLVILNDGALGVSNGGKVILKTLHVWIGYVFVVNLLFRFAWAFLGNRYARWGQMFPGGAGYGRALIALETEDLEGAVRELRRVLELDPDFADAHHTLGLALEELGDEAGMVHHFLRTRALDAKLDKERGVGSREDVDRIERTARETLDGLPEPFASKLKNVPVLLENRPQRALVEQGFDPRAFGLFEGPVNGEDAPAPTRIVLFTSNLLANFSGEDLEVQVEITVLHEVGHYFGLDEDDMERLGEWMETVPDYEPYEAGSEQKQKKVPR